MNSNNEIYKQNREILKYSISQFDKSVIYISSGALTISMAFINNFIKDISKANNTNFLIISWTIFSFIIFIGLVAHYISYMAHLWSIKNENLKTEDYNKKSKIWNYIIRTLNILSILGIFIGLLFLIFFINKNI